VRPQRPVRFEIAESARLDCYAGGLGGGMQIVSSGRQRIVFGCDEV
jgi:hypothetical protein